MTYGFTTTSFFTGVANDETNGFIGLIVVGVAIVPRMLLGFFCRAE